MTVLESFTTLRFPSLTPRSRLENLLAHLADVRAGEGVVALLLRSTCSCSWALITCSRRRAKR